MCGVVFDDDTSYSAECGVLSVVCCVIGISTTSHKIDESRLHTFVLYNIKCRRSLCAVLNGMSEKKYELRGVGGLLSVYEDKVVIEIKGLLGFLSQGLAGGKTIPMDAIQSVQFKKAGSFVNGFIQFGIMGGREVQGGVFNAANDENSVIFTPDLNDKALEIKEYIESIILNRTKAAHTVVQQTSAADEILKYKNLLDQGILTQQEFDTKKKELLGL